MISANRLNSISVDFAILAVVSGVDTVFWRPVYSTALLLVRKGFTVVPLE